MFSEILRIFKIMLIVALFLGILQIFTVDHNQFLGNKDRNTVFHNN